MTIFPATHERYCLASVGKDELVSICKPYGSMRVPIEEGCDPKPEDNNESGNQKLPAGPKRLGRSFDSARQICSRGAGISR